MDDKEREDLRAKVRFAFTCDDIELTDEQADSCVAAVKKAEGELANGLAAEFDDQWARARARAEKENRPLGEVLFEEGTARYEAYWANERKKNPTPSSGAD
jgi:hypothetical protein